MLFGKINKKYAWEIALFYKLRQFKDGIDFFEFNIGLDLFEGDHNPKFRLLLIIFNFTIIDIEVYNMFHIDK